MVRAARKLPARQQMDHRRQVILEHAKTSSENEENGDKYMDEKRKLSVAEKEAKEKGRNKGTVGLKAVHDKVGNMIADSS